MNKSGKFSISSLSASAVAVLVGAFMIMSDHTFWGIGFIALAILLAIITNSQ